MPPRVFGGGHEHIHHGLLDLDTPSCLRRPTLVLPTPFGPRHDLQAFGTQNFAMRTARDKRIFMGNRAQRRLFPMLMVLNNPCDRRSFVFRRNPTTFFLPKTTVDITLETCKRQRLTVVCFYLHFRN